MPDEQPTVATKAPPGQVFDEPFEILCTRCSRYVQVDVKAMTDVIVALGECPACAVGLGAIIGLGGGLDGRRRTAMKAADDPPAPDRMYLDAEVAHWSAGPAEEGGDVQ